MRRRPSGIDKQYQRGLMTAEERRGELIEIWTKATNEVAEGAGDASLPQGNPLWVHDPQWSPRQHAAAAPDLGDPWSGGQPEG